MYVLAFDTTASACSIALYNNDKQLSCYSKIMDYGQSEVLLPEIQKMLSDNNINFSDIQVLFVCVGPGSFTGVRSSVSAARTFQLACPDLNLGGISAFEAYAQSFLPEDIADINAVIIETKRDDFYVQFFNNKLQKIRAPQALTRDDIIAQIKGKKVSLLGDGVERFLSVPSGLTLHSIKMPSHLDIDMLVQAGLKQYYDKCLDYPKPLYLRAPDVSSPKANQN